LQRILLTISKPSGKIRPDCLARKDNAGFYFFDFQRYVSARFGAFWTVAVGKPDLILGLSVLRLTAWQHIISTRAARRHAVFAGHSWPPTKLRVCPS